MTVKQAEEIRLLKEKLEQLQQRSNQESTSQKLEIERLNSLNVSIQESMKGLESKLQKETTEKNQTREALMDWIVRLNRQVHGLYQCEERLADDAAKLLLNTLFNERLIKEVQDSVSIGYWRNVGVLSLRDPKLAERIRSTVPKYLVPNYLKALLSQAKTTAEKEFVLKIAYLFYDSKQGNTPAIRLGFEPGFAFEFKSRQFFFDHTGPGFYDSARTYADRIERQFEHVKEFFDSDHARVMRFTSPTERIEVKDSYGDFQTVWVEIKPEDNLFVTSHVSQRYGQGIRDGVQRLDIFALKENKYLLSDPAQQTKLYELWKKNEVLFESK